MAQATDEERAFWARTIEKGKQADGDLEQALALMAKYQSLEATRADANHWSAKARAALDTLPEHPIRDMLDGLADYVVSRFS